MTTGIERRFDNGAYSPVSPPVNNGAISSAVSKDLYKISISVILFEFNRMSLKIIPLTVMVSGMESEVEGAEFLLSLLVASDSVIVKDKRTMDS